VKRLSRGLAASVLLAGAAALAAAGDVVVLKGGGVIQLKQPWVRRGNTAYLTRADGTLLSVPVSEIDRQATAVASAASASPPPPAPAVFAPPSTPAEALRSNRDGPKARVKITDSDVSHPMDLSNATSAAAVEDKKALLAGAARVEIATYDQKQDGGSLVVSGQLRNPTQQAAENVNLRVTVLDEKGQPIDAAPASLSNGLIEPGGAVDFTVKINVGERIVGSLRFAPTWNGPKPPPAPAAQRANAGQKAPAPVPAPSTPDR
jgi:hypothetical protein